MFNACVVGSTSASALVAECLEAISEWHVRSFCKEYGQEVPRLEELGNVDFLWLSGSDVQRSAAWDHGIADPSKCCVVTGFPGTGLFTAKHALVEALSRSFSESKVQSLVFKLVPATFVIRRQRFSDLKSDAAWRSFEKCYGAIEENAAHGSLPPRCQCIGNVWILKPTHGSCGHGIELHSDIEDMSDAVESMLERSGVVVVQKYIERPLLLSGTKFDLRVWVAMLSRDEVVCPMGKPRHLDVYVFDECYARRCSAQYTLADVMRQRHGVEGGTTGRQQRINAAHLTNCSLSNEADNTMSQGELQAFFDSDEKWAAVGVDLDRHVLSRAREYAVDVAVAGSSRLFDGSPGLLGTRRCQLLGFDFLLDDELRCWLIEANARPGLAEHNPRHARLVRRMLNGFIGLVRCSLLPHQELQGSRRRRRRRHGRAIQSPKPCEPRESMLESETGEGPSWRLVYTNTEESLREYHCRRRQRSQSFYYPLGRPPRKTADQWSPPKPPSKDSIPIRTAGLYEATISGACTSSTHSPRILRSEETRSMRIRRSSSITMLRHNHAIASVASPTLPTISKSLADVELQLMVRKASKSKLSRRSGQARRLCGQ